MAKDWTLRFCGIAAFTVTIALAPMQGLARQMSCTYDYITHITTLQLDDLGAVDGSILYTFTHAVSPTGGEDMFLFRGENSPRLRGLRQFDFIAEKLFYDPHERPSALLFVDFERPTLKELQFPAAHLEQSDDTITAPLVVWSCHRTD